MVFSPPIGESNFRRIRQQNAVYVDKTAAIVSIATSTTAVYLFTRPRRFGKSTFLSTLEAFFQLPELSGADATPLFEDLVVWQSVEAREHFQRYPVLALSFKDVLQGSWAEASESLRQKLRAAWRQVMSQLRQAELPVALMGEVDRALAPEAGLVGLGDGVALMCEALQVATGRPVVLLLDEYDAPLHAAWQHGYLDEALTFFRGLLGADLKENRHLHKAVITGILRVARESLFSGVNHLEVWSMLGKGFADTFGFTQPEVEDLAEKAGLGDRLAGLAEWYDGYLIGDVRLYNPWSVLRYLQSPDEDFQPWWVNTGGTALVESLLDRFGPRLWPDLEQLLTGGAVTATLDEDLIFPDLHHRPEALWSLLVAAGYLKPLRAQWRRGRVVAELTVPNEEVATSWERMASRHLEDMAYGVSGVHGLTRAMLAGDARGFEARLRDMVMNTLSFHDTAGDWPERVWQAFVLGILVHLDPDYEVRSNREVGYGRADVIVRPRQAGRPGAVLEFKRIEPGEDEQAAIDAALQQIADRRYASELREVASPVHEIAVVFAGKKPFVRFQVPKVSARG